MSYLDKVTVGSTTYDIQDSKAQADVADLKSAVDKTISLSDDGKVPFITTWSYTNIAADGTESESANHSRVASGYIPTNYDILINRSSIPYYTWLCYYDENKTFKLRAEQGATTSPTINKSYAYMRILAVDYSGESWTNPEDLAVVNNNYQISKANSSVPHVYYCEKDGSGDFTSLKTAIEYAEQYMDSVVYVGNGTWDIISELGDDYIESVSSSKRGIYLKNRIHLIFSPKAVVQCEYNGNTPQTIEWLSVFNAGEYGFTLEGANIKTKKIRYCVHDERDQDADAYINIYKNCVMYHDSTYAQGGQNQCIGGGLGLNGHVIVDGCIFDNPNVSGAGLLSYHNSSGSNAKSIIDVHGCYVRGTNTMRFRYYGATPDTQKTTILCHDNSVGSAIAFGPETEQSNNVNMELLAWNNEVRSN